jgi:hypothetical protein
VGENDESWLTALDEAKRSREGEDAKNAQFTPPTDNGTTNGTTNNGSRPGTAQTNVSNISVMTTGRGKAAAKGARSAANELKPPGTAPAAIGTTATTTTTTTTTTTAAGFDMEAKVPATEPDELSNVTEANRILFMRHILGKMEAHADLAAAAAAQDIDNDLQATGGGGGGGGGGGDGDGGGSSFPPTPVPKLDLGVTSMPSPVALMSTRAIEVTGPKGGLTVRSALAPDFVLATYL